MAMALSAITTALFANRTLARQMSIDAWAADQQMRGEKVALFRQYADGDHRSYLTTEMRNLLRLSSVNPNSSGGTTGAVNSLTEFNDNYMDVIISTEADRLKVAGLDASGSTDSDTAKLKAWVDTLLDANRFDGLQMDLHEACLRDADTFVFVDWVPGRGGLDQGHVRFTHEPAYDGTSGMLVLYDEPGVVGVALKVWYLSGKDFADTCRVNVYYPDRIEKYIGQNGQQLQPYVEDGQNGHVQPWVMPDGKPLGVPVIHFANRGQDAGISEIENAIPLQDALNRTLISMVMTAELTAFQIRYSIGLNPPAAITPGMWIKAYAQGEPSAEQVAWFNSIKLGAISQGDIMPFIEQAKWLKGEIGYITRTPAPEFSAGDTASGESLKQREIGLLGKVARFQVKAGNRWEDVVKLAQRVQTAYGTEKPPVMTRVTCRWKDAEIRNNKDTIDNILKVADRIGERETLRQLSSVFGWDEAKIDELLNEKQQAAAQKFASLTGNMPRFNNFQNGQVQTINGG